MTIRKLKEIIKSFTIIYADEDEDQSFQRGVDAFYDLIKELPNIYSDDITDSAVATNGSEILVKEYAACEEIADLIDDYLFVGESCCHTGYYDPEEDKRSNEVDENTGWYYINFD